MIIYRTERGSSAADAWHTISSFPRQPSLRSPCAPAPAPAWSARRTALSPAVPAATRPQIKAGGIPASAAGATSRRPSATTHRAFASSCCATRRSAGGGIARALFEPADEWHIRGSGPRAHPGRGTEEETFKDKPQRQKKCSKRFQRCALARHRMLAGTVHQAAPDAAPRATDARWCVCVASRCAKPVKDSLRCAPCLITPQPACPCNLRPGSAASGAHRPVHGGQGKGVAGPADQGAGQVRRICPPWHAASPHAASCRPGPAPCPRACK